MKKVFVKTYGCQMNEYDSGRMSDIMQEEGYQKTDNENDADLIILNTCHIREKASEKVYSELGRVNKRSKATGKKPVVAVAGCVAQAEGAEILKRAKNVDMVFGPQSYHKLPEFLKEAEQGKRVVETEFHEEDKFDIAPIKAANKVTAFLSVQEGCDKFCTFCVVPYTRGAEFSRPVADILSEAKDMVAKGIREITLLGQNVNAFHGKGEDGKTVSLGELLYMLSDIDGLERIRYTTSHPRDMHDILYKAHADLPKIMPYLHLPVQAGSDRILKAMNRKHTAEEYVNVIQKMRDARPDLALSGDFIVGFPGETEEDFEATMEIARKVKYASSFSFKYSPRPGTPAAEMEDMVPDDVASKRLARLQALLFEQQREFNQSLIGKELSVLVEKKGRHEGQMIGRSPYLQAVYFDANQDIQFGDFVTVKIENATQNSLSGSVIDKRTEQGHHIIKSNEHKELLAHNQ